MPDKLFSEHNIDAIPVGLDLDIAVEQQVMPGNIDVDQLNEYRRFITWDRIAAYSTDMRAAWQVILMVRGWNFSRPQAFLIQLQTEVSKAAGEALVECELLANMRPEHVCRAALKTARFR